MIYYFPHLLIALGSYGIYRGGFGLWWGILILFFGIPILEFIFKKKIFKPENFKSVWAEGSVFLTSVTLSALLGIILWKAYQMSNQPEYLKVLSGWVGRPTVTKSDWLGLVLSGGALLGAFGITSAHELVHRRKAWQRAFGVYNLALVNFAHWGVEHVFGHHKWAATPMDPATARRKEWLYVFWVRSYFGVLAGAFKIAREKIISYWVVTLLVSVGLFYFLNPTVMLVWWACSAVAILLLQTVDYIEHYALIRPQNQEGHYMAFKPLHSWDSEGAMTNITLFNLGFHSHHHMKPLVQFEDLKAQTDARQMPYGYSIMVPLALFPFIYIPLMERQLTSGSSASVS